MIWFTSDTHFGHENILRFCSRPWGDASSMARAMIDSINERVAEDDELYILGDFSYKIGADAAAALRRGIACRRVHLVPGNHDRDWSRPELEGTFVVEAPIYTLKLEGGRKVVLCHYPMESWPSMAHGSIHLHGHIHAGPRYNEGCRRRGLLRYDVGVDANGYAPVSLEDVLSFFEGTSRDEGETAGSRRVDVDLALALEGAKAARDLSSDAGRSPDVVCLICLSAARRMARYVWRSNGRMPREDCELQDLVAEACARGWVAPDPDTPRAVLTLESSAWRAEGAKATEDQAERSVSALETLISALLAGADADASR